MGYYSNKIAIVTGGGSGIGQALSEGLARRGSYVVVTDINVENAEKVAAGINSSGGKASSALLDVTDENAVRKIIDDTAAEHGHLDFLFNNAGIAVLGETRDVSREQWRRIIDINLMGVVYGATEAYSIMCKQGSGHIVNISSQAGLHSVPGTTSYATAKHGVVGLSTSLRAEGAGLGVKVSVVCPGAVKTRIVEDAHIPNEDVQNFFTAFPDSLMMSADKAAGIILDEVARNKAIIVFPFSAKVLWWLFRINPSILNPFNKGGLKQLRKLRDR